MSIEKGAAGKRLAPHIWLEITACCLGAEAVTSFLSGQRAQ